MQRNDFRFCRTVGYWCLLLAHPNWWGQLFGFQRNIRLSPKLILSPQVASKVWVSKWTQSTVLSRVTHVTVLSEVICVMTEWNQSCPSSDASLSPCCNFSCKFVDRPQNVWSPNSCQVQAFFRQSVSILVIILSLIQVLFVWNWWSSEQGLETLQSCSTFFVCQLSLNAFGSMTFHVVGPRHRLCVVFSPPPTLVIFICCSRNTRFKTSLVYCSRIIFIRFAFTLSTSQIYMVKKWCGFIKIQIVHQFVPYWIHILLSFQPFFNVIHVYR